MNSGPGMRRERGEEREMAAVTRVRRLVARSREPAQRLMLETEQSGTAEHSVSERSEVSHDYRLR